MKHINLDSADEQVKQFVLSLKVDSEGSVLELDGEQVLRVIPVRSGEPCEDREGDLAAIRAGIDDMEAGRVTPIAEADVLMRKRLGFPPKRP